MTEVRSAAELKRRFVNKLMQSGLTVPKDATRLQFEPLLADQISSKFIGAPPVAGFCIPYFDNDGNPLEFCRVRFLESTLGQWDKLTTAKEIRYWQPPNSQTEVYLPPTRDWPEFLKSKERLIITEGELKAAAACKAGFPCIALGGVWSFQSTKQGLALLPWFVDNAEALADREVIICYDSDAATNPQVVMAENRLAQRLLAIGMIVKIMRLPQLSNASGDVIKTGIDDYLVLRSASSFGELLDEAKLFDGVKELHALNEEVVYVRDPGLITRLSDFRRIAVQDFMNHAYATRVYMAQVNTGNGTKLVEKSAPKEWIKWRHRLEATELTYAPEGPRFTESGALNVWPGYGKDGKLKPAQGDVTLWEEFLSYMFQEEPEAKQWFCRWLAYPIQHPGTKLATAVVIWGLGQGTGKTMLLEIPGAVYGRNFTTVNQEDLFGSFNDWADSRQFVLGDEITSGDRRGIADKLKSMITQTRIRVNQKYVKAFEIQDYVNYGFTSNHPNAFIMQEGDRRLFVHRAPDQKKPEAFYRQLARRYLHSNAGQAAMLYWLKNYPLGDFNPHGAAPFTLGKAEMTDLSKSDVGVWVDTLKHDPDQILMLGERRLDWSLVSTEELCRLYDPSGYKRISHPIMARELQEAGFRQAAKSQGIRTKEGQKRLWIMRNATKLEKMTGADLGRLYNKERGLDGNERPTRKEKF